MKENKIISGPIWLALVQFFVPCWLGMLFQQLYNMADTYVVSNFVGKNAVAAVGSMGVAVNVVIGVCVSIAGGAGVVISQHFGACRMDRVRSAVGASAMIALVGGGVLTVACVALSGKMVEWMNTPADIAGDAAIYIRVYFCAMVPNLLYNFGAAILRGMGDSKRPLYVLVVTSVANILLDLLFVAGLGWGVLGVAIATDLSMILSAAMVVILLLRQLPGLRIAGDKSSFSEIFRIGIPSALQSLMYSFSNVLIQMAINSFDTAIIAAWAIYGKVDCVCWMTMSSMGLAVTSFAGQNFGAGNYDRVKRGAWIGSGMLGAALAVLVVMCYAWARPIFAFFNKEAEVVEYGAVMLRFLAPAYMLYFVSETLPGVLRGCGDVVVPTIASMIGICLIRVLWLTVAVPRYHTLHMVMMSYVITWALTSAFYLVYFLRGKWLGRCIAKQTV